MPGRCLPTYFEKVPAIRNPRLAVTPERVEGRATVRVTCDIRFTDFEVNAMNRLGLRYLLACHLVNRYFFYDRSVVTFLRQEFPRTATPAVQQRPVAGELVRAGADRGRPPARRARGGQRLRQPRWRRRARPARA